MTLTKQSTTGLPSLEEMLKQGIHFGHQASKRHPNMVPYIFMNRNNVSIIDLEQTRAKLQEALEFVKQIIANGGVILFVGSKKQARDIMKKAAQDCKMPYIVGRWIGGIFTNFDQVHKLVAKMEKLEEEQKKGVWEKYKKSEQVKFKKELSKLNEFVGGIRSMSKLPKAIFIMDIKKEKTAVAEANATKIPIVAVTDTNVNPAKVQYPIPANDDAISAIRLMGELMSETINKARLTFNAELK